MQTMSSQLAACMIPFELFSFPVVRSRYPSRGNTRVIILISTSSHELAFKPHSIVVYLFAVGNN